MKRIILLSLFSILYSISQAQFTAPIIITQDGSPHHIVSADLNLDGFKDLVYTSDEFNVDTPTVHIVLNNGGGNYLPPSATIKDIGQGFAVGVGDLNGDGIPDIAAKGTVETEFNWYAGNGDGTFSAANVIQSSEGGSYISKIAIFDLDANGHNDIVIVNRNFSINNFGFVGWFKNNGGGNIDTLVTIFDELINPFDMDHGDLDGDIYPDVVVGQQAPDAVIIIEYDGAGSFSYETLENSMDWATEVLIADLNLDGENEILASESNMTDIVGWKRLDYPVPFNTWGSQSTIFSTTGIISGMFYKDINEDLKPDLIYNQITGEVGYFLNATVNDEINFEEDVEIWNGGGVSREFVVTDSDNDSDEDIIFISQDVAPNTTDQVVHLRNLTTNISINGNVFWDENGNGLLDSNEDILPNFPIQVLPNGFTAFTDAEGVFQIFGEAGNYELTAEVGDCWALGTGGNVLVNFDGENTVNDVLLGVTQVSNAEEVQINLSSTPTRCGFTVPFWLNYTNTGCERLSGKVQLLPSDLTTFITSNLPPDQTINDTLFWDFENLVPGENRQIDLVFEIAGVQNIGDTIQIPLQCLKENPDGSFTAIDSSLFTSIINCAYDPNDKQTQPRRSEIAPYDRNYTLMEERIDYTVRFQNTGTDTAFNIVIRDTLSTDLDWTTFQPLSASHPFETVFADDGTVEFFFRDILLVDSFTNEPLSHGYVQFHIYPKENLPNETSIFNSASIYFDFNPPILTNTVENLMVDMLPVFTSTNETSLTPTVQIFPNPLQSGEALHLKNLWDGDNQISIFDAFGRRVFFEKINSVDYIIQSENWNAGIYFILIENGIEKLSGKVILN
ncbi:MAG: FG-GAP-like repeat-containing protein [Bacteroidota bacterium]